MKTEEKPKADEVTITDEEVEENPSEMHKVCPTCNPPIVLGDSNIMVALCGKKFTNASMHFGYKVKCEACMKLVWPHIRGHFRDMWKIIKRK